MSDAPERVAIAHEWLHSRAGSERVFERLASLFPQADLFALTQNPGIQFSLGGRKVRTTFLDTRLTRDRRSVALPLMPIAWKAIRERGPEYDLLITSSHAYVNLIGIQAKERLSYVHSPIRYAWLPELDRRSRSAVPGPILSAMRATDKIGAASVDRFAANSATTAKRVLAFYGRRSDVIYPPVECTRFLELERPAGGKLLSFGRFVPYKGHEIAIRACAAIGASLVVAGHGSKSELDRLQALGAEVGARVEFVVDPSDEEVDRLYGQARALIFPAVEDFGIIPVEAMAAGVPVVCPSVGGASETVVDGITGVHASAPGDVAAFADAINRVCDLKFDVDALRQRALRFSATSFDRRILNWVESGQAPGRSEEECG